MVWFSEEVISPRMIFRHYLQRLKQEDFDKPPNITLDSSDKKDEKQEKAFNSESYTREKCVEAI